MNRYMLPITCGRCGGELQPVTEGSTDGLETRAVAECPACDTTHLIHVTLTIVKDQIVRRPASERGRVEHGTDRGYHQHRRRSERACRACLDAHANAALRRKVPA